MNQDATQAGLYDAQYMLGNLNPYNKGNNSFEEYEKAYAKGLKSKVKFNNPLADYLSKNPKV